MILQFRPHSKNLYPLEGLLIKNKEVVKWLEGTHQLGIDLNCTPVFAIPDRTPNSIWGCFVWTKNDFSKEQLENVQRCQIVQNRLFLPEYTIFYPLINTTELESCFGESAHIFHPDFGLYELGTPVDWKTIVDLPLPSPIFLSKPSDGPFVPGVIRKLEVKPLPPDALLEKMEEKIFPQKKTFEEEPLNWKEKIKYTLLKKILPPAKNATGQKTDLEQNPLLSKVIYTIVELMPFVGKQMAKLMDDLEDLEQRNRSEMEKLLKMFEQNPNEAIKYAIPIDSEGTGRGGQQGGFTLLKRWSSFGLFGSNGASGAGRFVIENDAVAELQRQYYQTAANYEKANNYEMAAFVYMKLLRNHSQAARVLEAGKLYSEAAAIYLKYLNNKQKAAECYEKGRMISEAIGLYIELEMHEKAGDLYAELNQKQEAYRHYQKVVDEYLVVHKYVKASQLLVNKMENLPAAQELLLTGWREQKDALNCLSSYFNNIDDLAILSQEIDLIYRCYTNGVNKVVLVKVLKHEAKKDKKLALQTKEIAYEIVSELAPNNPAIVTELSAFNKDAQLSKDLTRFKMQSKSKRHQ